MPIVQTVEGDLIKIAKQGAFHAIAHGCNCFNTMGSGIAPQIAKAFPEAWLVDQATSKGVSSKIGGYTVARCELPQIDGVLYVFNLYTQYGMNEQPFSVNYGAVAECFKKVNDKLPATLFSLKPKLGIPMIGAGLGGGHWQAISTIIDLVTPDLDITLVKYKK